RRWEAVLAAAEARGLAAVEIGPHAPTIEGGRDALRRVLASRATAVIGYNDLVAIGVMQAAADRDVAVPRDLSVAGFDDIFGSELIVPALTTVRTDLVAAGRGAATMVLERIGDATRASQHAVLPTSLVVRGSTGTAPAANPTA
ncbi:MAG: substrate-binding domain-containing protein, partial [Actinomycetes bacterium]|nr:substrate-binding domain-containing protein [Actinomycetes bacterium]MDX5449505.1 substrate-binding domain-containing protein [Actinomycetes bacterium]